MYENLTEIFLKKVSRRRKGNTMKKMVKSFALVLLVLSLVACGAKKGPDGAGGKKTITFAKENDIASMDSRYATDGMSFEIIAATTEGLMSVDKDGKVIHALAESHEVSDDQLTWTFKLRDAKWANDDPVTAHDFVYAWQDANTNPDAIYNYLFTGDAANIVNAAKVQKGEVDKSELGVKALDDKTLEIKLDNPVSFFDSLMAFPVFFPLNEKFVTEQGENYALDAGNLVANGPFKMVSWEKGSKVTLEKNPTYWDAANVKADQLVFNIIGEASTAVLDFEGGSTDFVKLNSDLVDKYKESKEFTNVLEGYLWYMMYNFEHPALSNQKIREAIAIAVDKDQLVNNVLKDGSVPGDGFVPVGLATGPDGKDYRESAPVYNKSDKEKAKQLWAEGKKEAGVDNVKIKFLFETSDPAKPAAEFIQSELTSTLEGLEIEMVGVPKENRLQMQREANFDIQLTRWGPDYSDPTTYLNLMLKDSTYNFGGYNNPEYDKLETEALVTFDIAKRWNLLQEAEGVLMKDLPVAPMFQVGGASLINSKVTGIETHAVGVPYLYKNVDKAE